MRNDENVTFLSLKDNTSHEKLRFSLNVARGHLWDSVNALAPSGEADLTWMHSFKKLLPQLEKEFFLRIAPQPQDIRKIKTSFLTSTLHTYNAYMQMFTERCLDSTAFPSLSRKDLALQFFDGKLAAIPEEIKLYYNIREVENRPPGYIVDLLIVIPTSNRGLEYRIYSALRDLTTTYVDLLFNFRIVRRRGRPLPDIVTEGYQQYV